MKFKLFAVAAVAAIGIGCAGSASADTINFGQFSGTLPNVTTGTTTGGVGFTMTGPGGGFSILTQDVTWLGNFPDNTPVLWNNSGPGSVTFDFNTPITSISKIAIESNYYGAFVGTLDAYDGSTLVGSESVDGVSAYAPNTAPAFDVSAPVITSIVISTTNDGVGFGLGGVGGTGGYNGSGVPEPAAWAMMLAGFFGIGAATRANRRKAAVA